MKNNFFKKKTEIIKENATSTIKSVQNPIANAKLEKKKKPKATWDSKFELLDVQYPKEISNAKFKKRYKLNLLYKDADQRQHRKTIRFGQKDVKEFVDDGDNTKKNRVAGKLGNTHNMLHGNFWRLHLLNGDGKNLKENYLSLLSKIN